MQLDANTFAKWDVDYVKLDGCYSEIDDMDEGYPEFGRLLNKTGRPMVYSCSWPVYKEVAGVMVIHLYRRNMSFFMFSSFFFFTFLTDLLIFSSVFHVKARL